MLSCSVRLRCTEAEALVKADIRPCRTKQSLDRYLPFLHGTSVNLRSLRKSCEMHLEFMAPHSAGTLWALTGQKRKKRMVAQFNTPPRLPLKVCRVKFSIYCGAFNISHAETCIALCLKEHSTSLRNVWSANLALYIVVTPFLPDSGKYRFRGRKEAER